MKNFVQDGKVLAVEAADTVAAGDFVKVGELHGFVQSDAVIGQMVAVVTEGVYETTVQAEADIAAGDPIFAPASAGFLVDLTTAADDGMIENPTPNVKVGFATESAAALAGVATVNVKLA